MHQRIEHVNSFLNLTDYQKGMCVHSQVNKGLSLLHQHYGNRWLLLNLGLWTLRTAVDIRNVYYSTCKALTTLIGCSSPRARMQRWNKQLMLSFIFINSSPSRDSNFPSKYSRFTCQTKGRERNI